MSSVEPIIALLPDAVISQIAAGEVVERPASIIKELIENSLDAGASNIRVEYDDRGPNRLAVTDDGAGIEPGQVELALTRHATSKIRVLDDLQDIASLGFRGEALASIAAVSEIELVTRVRGREDAARVLVRSGKVLDFSSKGFSHGTRVDVRDLFAEVPARAKFLKTASTEFGLVTDTVRRYALGYSDRGFTLEHNGKEVSAYPPVSWLRDRVAQVMGGGNASAMVEVDAEFAGMRLYGFASRPGVSHGSNRWMSAFVNRRWVRDRVVMRAVIDAYKTYLLKGRFPAHALFLEVDGAAVDVNVHPAKTELRFSKPGEVGRFLSEAITHALREGASPLGRWGVDAAALELKDTAYRARGPAGPEGPARDPEPSSWAGPTAGPRIPQDESGAPVGYRVPRSDPAAASREVQESFAVAGIGKAGVLGSLEVIGQVFDGYIVCRGAEGLVIVDQHAAHERVLYERLRAEHARGIVQTQPLLLSVAVELPEADVASIERSSAELAGFGWCIDVAGEREVLVREVPALAVRADVRAVVQQLAADLTDSGRSSLLSTIEQRVMATVACHSAVRVGKRLDRAAMTGLLAEAATVDFSASCPHGRPVAAALSRTSVERLFGR